jgi:hypothetical protein
MNASADASLPSSVRSIQAWGVSSAFDSIASTKSRSSATSR